MASSPTYRLEWRKSVKKDLRKIPGREVAKIVATAAGLASDPFPHGAVKLTGSEHVWRVRVGDYRVIYEVFTTIRLVGIDRVKHRKDVYR